MAILEHIPTGRLVSLEPRHLVGRAPSCTLCLPEGIVSGEHATLFWSDEGWKIRDLGSRNGTWLEGERLKPGRAVALPEGAELGLGDASPGWALVDAAPPAEDEAAAPIAGTAEQAPEGMAGVGLRFRVSTDEEYVEIEAILGGRVLPLPPRTHHEILLVLARARLADQRPEVPEADRGWVYADELRRMLRADASTLRVGIHRARKQLEEAGVIGATELVERRSTTGQLRIGTGRLEVLPL